MKKFLSNITIFMTFVFVLINPKSSYSITLNTNMKDVVIKDVEACVGGYSVYGTLVNRSNRLVSGYLKFKYFDNDRDPIGSCSTKIYVFGNEGKMVTADRCNCDKAAYVVAEIDLSSWQKKNNEEARSNIIDTDEYNANRFKKRKKSFSEKFFDFFK